MHINAGVLMYVLLLSRGQFKALFVVWVRRYLFIYLFIFFVVACSAQKLEAKPSFCNQEAK